MICAGIDAEGYVYVVDPSPADPGLCDLVILSGDALPWFALTTEQATELAVSIGLLWGFAFVCRSFVRQIMYSR